MKQQLFKPFRMGQWIRLAVTGLLAGEMGSAGGCNLQFPFNFPSRPRSQAFQIGRLGLPEVFIILLLVMLMFIFMVAFVYVSSRMRFVLFDSIVAGECRIGEFWRRRGNQGYRYFLFQLLFLLCMIGGFLLTVGVPLGFLAALGWLRAPREHLFGLILAGGLFFSAFLAMIFLAGVVQVLTKDFVVPQM